MRQRIAKHVQASSETPQILYGGNIKAHNAEAIFCQADVDGGLIGVVSLDAEDFI